MATELPEYYFRIRDNGAVVFRIDTENRQRRIEMDQIAVVNVRNGEVKPHGQSQLSPADMAAITDWTEARRSLLAEREMDEIRRTVEHLNRTAHWVNARASAAQLDEVGDDLLMAMHDLRSLLVRKKADR
jgi:hypothetical protein